MSTGGDSAERYADWKNWKDDAFGSFDSREARYFAHETGIPSSGRPRVLEIGFGNGQFIAWARSVGAEVFGVELSETLVTRARSLLGEERAHRSMDELISRGLAHTFSYIVAFDVLEHIQQTELQHFFGRMTSLLAPGGRVILRFPNGDSPFGRLHQHADPTHVTTIGAEKLRYFARLANLRVMEIRAPTLPLSGAAFTRLMKRNVLALGHFLVERSVGMLYFGGRIIPLSPNYLAILVKPEPGAEQRN